MNKHIDIRVIFDDIDEDWFYKNIPSDDIHSYDDKFISFSGTYQKDDEYYTVMFNILKSHNKKYDAYFTMDDEDVPDHIQTEIISKMLKGYSLPNTKIKNELLTTYSITSALDVLSMAKGKL